MWWYSFPINTVAKRAYGSTCQISTDNYFNYFWAPVVGGGEHEMMFVFHARLSAVKAVLFSALIHVHDCLCLYGKD